MSATATLPTYELEPWDLSALLPEPSTAVIAERLQALEGAVARFEGYRDRLVTSGDRALLGEILRPMNASARWSPRWPATAAWLRC